jgi:Flp pilus assembly protein TadD
MYRLLLLAFLMETPEELYQRGLHLMAEHQAEAAIGAFRQAAELRPGDGSIWKALGVAFASLGDYSKAEEPFRQACRLNPRLPDACLYLGRTLYLQDRFGPALEILRQGSPSAQSRRIEAMSLEALGRADDARAAFEQAMRLPDHSPPNEDPGIDFGVFLFRQAQAAEALPVLRDAVARHPDASRAHLELGCVLLAVNLVEESVAHLERAAALEPGNARAHLLLGKAYLRTGKAELAHRELDQGSRTVK